MKRWRRIGIVCLAAFAGPLIGLVVLGPVGVLGGCVISAAIAGWAMNASESDIAVLMERTRPETMQERHDALTQLERDLDHRRYARGERR